MSKEDSTTFEVLLSIFFSVMPLGYQLIIFRDINLTLRILEVQPMTLLLALALVGLWHMNL